MILDPKFLEQSVDAWAKGQRSEQFNGHAQPASAPRTVSMVAANDKVPTRSYKFGGA